MKRNNKPHRTSMLQLQTDALYQNIRSILENARFAATRAINIHMVNAYWQVGRLIVEHEQGGKSRAAYGRAVLEELSRRLSDEFGRGFDVTNLRKMRQFYRMFEIRDAVRLESGLKTIRHLVRDELGWSHYRLLMQVETPAAREWYMKEAISQRWSSRQLDRQISVLYYERLLSSRKAVPVRREAKTKLAAMKPDQFIRDPYVLNFLNLQDYPALRESKVEQAIIHNLQSFLLELGKGFSFVARQKRMRFENEDFYVDLVFYNYLLRCFVLIDLKVGKLTHQDIGQMDSYVRMFDAHAKPANDNPTIGLVLCSQKNEAVAKYSVLAENRRLFAAKYLSQLPTEEELRQELERERELIETQATELPRPKQKIHRAEP